ncbi:hypothetical protein EDB81DRAFT_866684 [Dactylonectria macrodidyma]|uniref:Zn(2)-C6 fungal-type domain-containing protein n=1 Tax=Dactylonectria macrodidyma TaxID=307937 RepID=A0A9P9FG13_9HYPO|nr:hypothetical protein EDB81DRAFT_866684 [Dactylonectria macrodidyma]
MEASQEANHVTYGNNRSSADSEEQSTSRHVCHCGKRFIRKEHLRRHQATHDEGKFICSACQRSFTRKIQSDVLRRHLARHNMPAAPDHRRGRACDACRANKTTCDRGTQCTLCAKRGIDCTYKFVSTNRGGCQSPTRDVTSSASTALPQHAPRHIGIREAFTPAATSMGTEVSQSPGEDTLAGRLAQIANKLLSREISVEEDPKVSSQDNEWMEANSNEFFGRFNDAWPIIHGPLFFRNDGSFIVSISVVMISSWLENPDDFSELALLIHESLMEQFFRWLSERVVTRATVLRGMLVSSMREMEFFIYESAAYEQQTHYPGTFIPYLQIIRDRWKRLVVALYKVDVYLSIARDQPPALYREEMDATMPSTYFLWNSYDLNLFIERLSQEPTGRARFRLSEVMDNHSSPAKPLVLLEDVQLALCGLRPEIWNHAQVMRRSTESGRLALNSIPSSGRQLETWKADLDRITHQCSQSFHTGQTEEFPFLAYIGKYHEDPPRAKARAMTNIKCLASDCRMTYHLQGLQLYADTRIINTVARSMTRSRDDGSSASLRMQKYQSQLNAWTSTSESRRALLHAIAVLWEREADLEESQPQKPSVDPIAWLTVSMSALVVWAWLVFSTAACSCVPMLSHIDIGVEPRNLQNTTQLEGWIHSGGTAALQSIPLCRCMADGWMARYNALLPHGSRRWELSDDIAPVLQRHTSGE